MVQSNAALNMNYENNRNHMFRLTTELKQKLMKSDFKPSVIIEKLYEYLRKENC